ncbi:MAG: CCA tRNA nucleotidyltransferase [Caryophanon sp.]|nr:CCA tRNA nucleotidyltransferase [Caryophanon sp.]
MNEQMQIAKHVMHKLEEAGYEAVLVGGAVRDMLLGRPFHDVDVATAALPEEVKALFPKTVDVGIEHGTVLVLVDGIGIEVTTYRTELAYSDHRRPDGVQFVRNLRDDLQRRDFTMNALAMRANGELVDYYGGEADLQAGVIRAVGNASERFFEDALRMLRAGRFVGQLGFVIEAQTEAAIAEHAQLIEQIAVERVQMELNKLFVSPFVARGIAAMRQTRLSDYVAGTFDEAQWQHVHIEDVQVGWAYFAYVSQLDAAEMARAYRLANKEKQFIAQVLALATNDDWQTMDYFHASIDVLQAAQHIRTCQSLPTESIEAVQAKKASLPIQTKDELAVNGQHVMAWHDEKRGPWLKDALAAILQAVVTGDVQNDAQQIKDWFMREWINERARITGATTGKKR